MTTSGLAAPARSVEPEWVPPPAPPRLRRSIRIAPRPRRPAGRVEGWSLVLWAVIHVLLVVFLPSLLVQSLGPPGGAPARQVQTQEVVGMEIAIDFPSASPSTQPEASPPAAEPLTVAPTNTGQTVPLPNRGPTPANPVPAPVSGAPGAGPSGLPPQPTTGTSAGGPSSVTGTGPSGSVREALRPGYSDPRLYVPIKPIPGIEQTQHERYMEHLTARLEAVNDSMSGARNAQRTTSDWVITDADGNKWGLSPEGLHLGGITIPRELLPLPAPTGDNASLEAARERQRQRDEIQRQAEDAERARIERERIEAIRKEQEQRRSNQGGN